MKNITTRQYRLLCDHMAIYNFMLQTYEPDCRNGVPAPFLEYALSSCWMSKDYTYLNRIWLDGDKIVAFCFTENPVSDIYFNLLPGYEKLADDMICYAKEHMPSKRTQPDVEDEQRLVLFSGQEALRAAAKHRGYAQVAEYTDNCFFFDKALDYKLPDGFRFTRAGECELNKISECCYKGFDHEEEDGPWDGDTSNQGQIMQAPHATFDCAIAVVNEEGDYVCYSGMWWTPENKLAYMEPLCTVPEYRHKGLASAVLSEQYRRMKAKGATHMTGGGNAFYRKIGFLPTETWTYWKLNPPEE